MPDTPAASVEPEAPVRSMTAAISNAVVGLLHDHTGRGPTRARTTITPDMVVVTLRDSLTKAERTLVERGRELEVLAARRALQDTMNEDLIAAVETLMGRTVEVLLGDTLPYPDIAVQVFLLERGDQNGARGAGVVSHSKG